MRIRFEQAGNISKVFLAFIAASRWIQRSPNFPLQNIFEASNRQFHPQNLALTRSFDKGAVTLIGLNLNAQVRAW